MSKVEPADGDAFFRAAVRDVIEHHRSRGQRSISVADLLEAERRAGRVDRGAPVESQVNRA